MRGYKKALLIVVALALAGVAVMAFGRPGRAEDPLRLHIVANSDSEEDQRIKIEVRDAVLRATREGIDACATEAQAEEYVGGNIEIIVATANEVLEENGAGYRAEAMVGTYHFPERTYRDATYPEGDYRALRIVLGEGEGRNWWCVMFPPLCITEITCDDAEYTSFFGEIWEEWLSVWP
jgi:stage II sporulation protein R